MDTRIFDKRLIAPSVLCRDVGLKHGRPFIISAVLTETSLGDLICCMTYLATLKAQFDNAKLFVRYRNIRPYSTEVMSLIPSIDKAVGVRWHIPFWARLGIADTRLWWPWTRIIDSKTQLHRSFCDFLATDWMLNSRSLHAIPNPAPLVFPEELKPGARQQLQQLGLDPDRWFMTLHYRTSTYLDKRSGQLRNGDPEANQKLVDYVIDELGGQVVQLGHPEIPPFPARPGFVDLSRIKNAFMIQAFAVANSRFLVAGPSGPVALGWGFQVPTGSVDASDPRSSWGLDEHITLTHEVTTPDGEVLQNKALQDAGLLEYPALRDKVRAGEQYTVRKNSFEELAAVAKHLHAITEDVVGWRAPAEPSQEPRPNSLTWPPQTNDNENFFDLRQDGSA
ncbi:MAG: TIGR04372 family glycosyltransferase [Pseudomonadota bacterium]